MSEKHFFEYIKGIFCMIGNSFEMLKSISHTIKMTLSYIGICNLKKIEVCKFNVYES